MFTSEGEMLGGIKKKFKEKVVPVGEIFAHIHRGDSIFVGTGCGVPQFLLQSLIKYVKTLPKRTRDRDAFHLWALGVTPHGGYRFDDNFRIHSFYIESDINGEAVSSRGEGITTGTGRINYVPTFILNVPGLIEKRVFPLDVALIQTTYPDDHGFMGLGVSADIMVAAVKSASIVIAQVNSNMPRVCGDGFVNLDNVDFIVPHDETLMEFVDETPEETTRKIGDYVARIISDGDTIQVGYGGLPNAILKNLENKNDIGIHTELFTDGISALMKKGVINNSRKSINRGKTTAAFCMGNIETYGYIHENMNIEFKTSDYVNHPLVIARNQNMTAINSAIQIDLTGQATVESMGVSPGRIVETPPHETYTREERKGGERGKFYRGFGGYVSFMRGAVLAPGGKTIIAIPSIGRGRDGEMVSRVVPFLKEGEAVALNRGDVHYVVSEYGIAYLHAKNIRERAMELIAIAHPDFRPWLIEEAKRLNFIYKDQAFVPGKQGEYPEHMEQYKTTRRGISLLMRPVKITDEPMLKEFFYSLSDDTLYKRFFTKRNEMPHQFLQKFSVIDYTGEMIVVAVVEGDKPSLPDDPLNKGFKPLVLINDGEEGTDRRLTRGLSPLSIIAGIGQYKIDEDTHTGDAALVVRDDFHNQGIGTMISNYLIYLARRQGLVAFTADVLQNNSAILHIFEKSGFDVEITSVQGEYKMRLNFR